MTALVVGGTGFIGPRLIKKLVEQGEKVVCMDLNPSADLLSGWENEVEIIRGDVTQFEDVMRAVIETQPDRLINLAYRLGGGEDNPHHAIRLNILGMDNCFEAARLQGVKRVIYASSIAVSGSQSHFGDRAATEDDPKYGTSQYAVCKIFNEFQAQQYIDNHGMSITGIRPANVTGPDKVRGSTDHVRCITLPAQGEPVRFPFKSLMRLPIHVEDISEAFARVLLSDAPHHSIYNSGGSAISLGDLAEIVRRFIPDARIEFDDDGGLEESGNYLVDNSRLLNEFEMEYAPFPQRVLEIINDVRQDMGQSPIDPA
jgi:nucleoside-diphosphate-sugar epimerase